MTGENSSFDVVRDEYHYVPPNNWPIGLPPPTEEKLMADHSGLFSVSAQCQNDMAGLLFVVPRGYYGIITFLYYENGVYGDPASLLNISDATGTKYQEVTKYIHKALVQRGDKGWMVTGPVSVISPGTDKYYVNATYYLVPMQRGD